MEADGGPDVMVKGSSKLAVSTFANSAYLNHRKNSTMIEWKENEWALGSVHIFTLRT